jgi:ATP-dependent helicase Lhr and Lhr-like helicase
MSPRFRDSVDDNATSNPVKEQRFAPTRSAPLTFLLRSDADWLRAASVVGQANTDSDCTMSPQAAAVRAVLQRRGACFLADLVQQSQLEADQVELGLWELVAAGLATADGFASMRILVDRKRGQTRSHFDSSNTTATVATPSWLTAINKARHRDRERPSSAMRSLPTAAGRWALLDAADASQINAELSARQLLTRYGVVFRDLLQRESNLPPWREILVALRRLEARGEIRGGRFVNGFVGEQYALPEALDGLRAARHAGPYPIAVKVPATDPLNLAGIVSPGAKVPALVGNAVLFVDGVAVASLESGRVVPRVEMPPGASMDVQCNYIPAPVGHDKPASTQLSFM